MPVWLIEFFGSRDLEAAFWFISLMTAPVWLAMLCFPGSAAVRGLASPLVLPPFYLVVLAVLLWKSWEAAALPPGVDSASYGSLQSWIRHPVAFLALYCNWQIVNLVLGTLVFQKASRCGFRAPVELVLCWALGALGLLPFSLRLLFRGQLSR
jgi:hypothetical protein